MEYLTPNQAALELLRLRTENEYLRALQCAQEIEDTIRELANEALLARQNDLE